MSINLAILLLPKPEPHSVILDIADFTHERFGQFQDRLDALPLQPAEEARLHLVWIIAKAALDGEIIDPWEELVRVEGEKARD
jgi:hypothetical protein